MLFWQGGIFLIFALQFTNKPGLLTAHRDIRYIKNGVLFFNLLINSYAIKFHGHIPADP